MCQVSREYGFCDWGVPHCKKCGEHFSPSDSERNDTCDSCVIDAGYVEVQSQVEAFGGNHEEAAKHFGW